ncbi:class I SAM-dependent methyltransferase [Desulfovibrio aminophilus]|uniref:class I SAM-dependent methyltransferase n=1 Tax=Desulfovibrio aminophilus TaxID=81425 RepID=UPI00040EBCA0|nr:class I SAM-dependent methyltransferase [Desulfovibrio aminophilus]
MSMDVQLEYWDQAASSKTFSHPIPTLVFRDFLPVSARILDYGCGYGRVCSELSGLGYDNVTGIDISGEMVRRGKLLGDGLDLRVFDGLSPDFGDGSFDACLLVALLTCVPSDAGQERVIREINRLLAPGGLLFVSDYPLQRDERNRARYREFERELGTFGMFRTEGAVFRHHDMAWVRRLLAGFQVEWEREVAVRTMNGHESDVFQMMLRKKA